MPRMVIRVCRFAARLKSCPSPVLRSEWALRGAEAPLLHAFIVRNRSGEPLRRPRSKSPLHELPLPVAMHARSLAPLVKARGLGMTQTSSADSKTDSSLLPSVAFRLAGTAGSSPPLRAGSE
jgi:hypothetical protein